jgi:hypothetical protein
MADFDKQVFASTLRSDALPPFGAHKCATYVRSALEAAGLNTTGHPLYAKDWGPTLLRIGFSVVASSSYLPQVGDIVVIQGTSTSMAGHIAGYDGKNWISDFVQAAMWPGPSYRDEQPPFVFYRYP